MQTSEDIRSRSDSEARRLYAAIFGRAIPDRVRERFVVASERLHASVAPAETDRYYRAIQACGDLEALEVAARYTRQLPLLSRKFRLMAYLAETLPENQADYINERSSLAAGLWQCAWSTLRSLYKIAAGLRLLRRVTRHA